MPSVPPSVKSFVPAPMAIFLVAAITLQPDPDNPRKSCDKEELERLGLDAKTFECVLRDKAKAS